MGGACALATLSIFMVTAGEVLGAWMTVVAALFGGTGSISMAYCLYARLVESVRQEHAISLLSISLVLSIALCFLLFLAGGIVGFLIVAVAPGAVFVLFSKIPPSGKPVGESGRPLAQMLKEERFPWSMVTGFAVFGFAFGFMRWLMPADDPFGALHLVGNTLFRGAGARAVLAVTSFSSNKHWTCSLAGIVCWVGAFVLLYFPGIPSGYPGYLSTMGYTCFELLMLALIVEIPSQTNASFTPVFSICSIAMLSSTLAGDLLALILPASPLGAYDAQLIQCVIFGAIVSSLVLFDSRRVSGLWGARLRSVEAAIPDDGEFARLLEEKFGLTPREGEIAVLLSKGRSEPYIAETLFLSRSTVQTHAHNAYVKMGVHSRQEFLDVLEEFE